MSKLLKNVILLAAIQLPIISNKHAVQNITDYSTYLEIYIICIFNRKFHNILFFLIDWFCYLPRHSLLEMMNYQKNLSQKQN